MPASALHRDFLSGTRDPVTVLSRYLSRCRDDPDNAMISVESAPAMDAARRSAERYAAGKPLGLLDGVPLAVKDNIAVEGLAWTAGIEAYRHRIAKRDANAVALLKAAGAVVIGKCNLHEAALGTSSDNPWFGRCHNPRRHGYTPGGSSGGSAAAVAGGLAPLALGTDTMGSVRIPAACCGVFGFKPGRGRVSLDGVTPLCDELDTIGLIAASMDDLITYGALLARIEAGQDPMAPRIGILPDAVLAQVTDDVASQYRNAIKRLTQAEVTTVEVDWPTENSRNRRAGLVLCEVEAYAEHRAALAEKPDGFSEGLRTLLEYGRAMPEERLADARRTAAGLTAHFRAMTRDVDAVVTPATTMPPYSFDEPEPAAFADFTAPANLTGRPAAAIPFGESADGLPLGLQVVGHPGEDGALLALTGRLHAMLTQ